MNDPFDDYLKKIGSVLDDEEIYFASNSYFLNTYIMNAFERNVNYEIVARFIQDETSKVIGRSLN